MSIYVFAEVSLAKWTCLKCKKPLSRFPIYITEKGSLCGRCEELQNGGFRCEIFEDIAKNVEFPCCYEQNGCPENLLPGNVANHELHCKFQTITCPFECPNKWIGFLHEFLEHTKKEHPTSVSPDDCCSEVDFITEKDCPLKKLYGCEKKLVYADLSKHIYKEHNKHWYEGEVISYAFEFHEEYKEVFILKYCSKLFRLKFSYRNKLFTFKVKLINSSEKSSNYRFVVDILDTTRNKNKNKNKNRLLCLKDLKAKEQAIEFNLASIRHLIRFFFKFRMYVLEN